MKARLGRSLKGAGIALAILCGTAVAQTSEAKGLVPQPGDGKGKSAFETSCAVCHGLDGGGGQHAPNIGRGSAAKAKPDAELIRILREGILSKGMPPFRSFGAPTLQSILSYLRFLQAKSETRSEVGDPVRGQRLFFGKGQCSDCHAMHGEGRFVSTDLSDFAYDHDANDIRVAITNPREQAEVPDTTVRATTSSGQQFSGVVRNENNSSLQIQDADGKFYLFMKADLQSVERAPVSPMPADYQQRLSPAEIDDLVSYIVRQAPASPVKVPQPTGHKKETQFE